MDAVEQLKDTFERLLEFKGDSLTDFLFVENDKLETVGIKVGDSLGLEPEEYVRSTDTRARWLLGQLRDTYLTDTRGVQLGVVLKAWSKMAYQTIKTANEEIRAEEAQEYASDVAKKALSGDPLGGYLDR